jgi:hypothetical protein
MVRPVLLTGQTGLELPHLRLRFFGLGFVDQSRKRPGSQVVPARPWF